MSTREYRVVHLQRRPVAGQFSVEGLFESLREVMKDLGHEVAAAIAPYPSKGFWGRAGNIWWAWHSQCEVNHITGDVQYLALVLPKKRTVLTVLDCYGLERLRGVKRWLLRVIWYDLPIRRSAIVTVISHETKRQLLRHVQVPEGKVVVVPVAVSRKYQPCPRVFCVECPTILQVGTAKNKNLTRLIDAIRGMQCRLKIIGDLDDQTTRQLKEAKISYESAVNLSEAEMYQAYCDADLVSFVSTYEGFGMPIVEAQWVERPVVTSNCSSMPEVAGEGACLVDPFDVGSIREGIQRVIRDTAFRQHLVEQGRGNRERFSLEEIAKQYLSLYERLAK
jgi:glycosyltransferase involved in cell wall biosynthesis